MKDDIVARLRDCTCVPHGEICREAADEIERLREALRIEQEELAACCIDRKETQRERNEARSIACYMFARRSTVNRLTKARWFAKNMGWHLSEEPKP